MIKELTSLANILDAKGLTKEADYVDSMINKFAQNFLETAARYWNNRLFGPKAEGSTDRIQHAIDFWTKNNWTKEDIQSAAKGFHDNASFQRGEIRKDLREFDRLLKERIEETSPFKDKSGRVGEWAANRVRSTVGTPGDLAEVARAGSELVTDRVTEE